MLGYLARNYSVSCDSMLRQVFIERYIKDRIPYIPLEYAIRIMRCLPNNLTILHISALKTLGTDLHI